MDKEKKYKVFKLITDIVMIICGFVLLVDIFTRSSYYWKKGLISGLIDVFEEYVYVWEFTGILFYLILAILLTRFIIYKVRKM